MRERRTSVSPTRARTVEPVMTVSMATPACVPVDLQVKACNPLAFLNKVIMMFNSVPNSLICPFFLFQV